MAIFDPVTLVWKGEEHVVAADKIMGLIARIEEVVTLPEIHAASQKNGLPLGRLAMAYGSALRYAGARVDDDEVYASFFGGDPGAIPAALTALLAMMVPPQRAGVATSGAPAKKRAAARRS